ncbi:putative monooxygenase [Wickerhamomyces ciferrii]|uniref:Monooxygenase n=1 Tax=Wickerhamomyces ciferrii (strain ATCC 14091 / BCRC 22168 / CBS 111 / JCM 3599 / NBRC 0793 / NRRL Y-1031 F-60-10) TaxID=1206466 RepID=K0KPV7_WICCF|nr:putative monooxygenase [Wickerhamomyces ciferrii]CCH44197.1 putative monooxygenase [Wickerhamomyces ciferrii]
MTQATKKQRTDKPKKQWIINAAGNGSASKWRHPKDTSSRLGHSVDAWIEYAQLAEKGKLNAVFIADHLALFDNYKGPNNYEIPAQEGLNVARIEPFSLVSALATHTENIGFGITASTVSEHPYHFARRLATADHLSKGRVGWNIVSSYLSGVGRQLLNGELPPHDERYVKTSEYLDVVYDLLLSSWRDDAVLEDKENGVFIPPDRIREVNHKGKYFDVPGPSIFQPTPQRFPLIIQAGSSSSGLEFAAENAEVVFLNSHDPSRISQSVKDVKKLAKEKYGRDPNHLKFLIPANVILGKTHEEAENKVKEYLKYTSEEWTAASFSSVTGIDISKFKDDEFVTKQPTSNAMASATESIINKGQKQQTKRDILDSYNKYGLFGRAFIGTPEEVADELEQWVEENDIDGFNFGFNAVYPQFLEDIVELLIPELQKRGVFHKEYPVPGGTFRENVFGVKGQNFFHEDHPAYKLRWNSNVSKEKFEKEIKAYNPERVGKRDWLNKD